MKAFLFAATAALALSSAPASAEVLQFVVKNTGGVDKGNFIFRLDTSAAPTLRTAEVIRYAVVDVRYGMVPSLGSGNVTTGISFNNQVRGGGLAIGALPSGVGLLQFRGPALLENARFAGTPALLAAPLVFKTGVFAERLTPGSTTDNYVVSIAAVPEPASWALMIGGFGAVGLGLRRQTRREAIA